MTIWNWMIDHHVFPVAVAFLISLVIIGRRYSKFSGVARQITPLAEVKKRIAAGERLVVYIIDPLKCSSCMNQFAQAREILEGNGLSFELVDFWEDEKFLRTLGEWKRVPVLMAYENGKLMQMMDASKVYFLQEGHYRQFAQEVSQRWKTA